MDAGTADEVLLDDADFHAKLGCPDRGHVAAGAATEERLVSTLFLRHIDSDAPSLKTRWFITTLTGRTHTAQPFVQLVLAHG